MTSQSENIDYEIEVEANLRELVGFVNEIKLLPRDVGPGICTYQVTLLEGGDPLRVQFIRGRGYFVVTDANKHYETFQALLSFYSPKYRMTFAAAISRRLGGLLTQ